MPLTTATTIQRLPFQTIGGAFFQEWLEFKNVFSMVFWILKEPLKKAFKGKHKALKSAFRILCGYYFKIQFLGLRLLFESGG